MKDFIEWSEEMGVSEEAKNFIAAIPPGELEKMIEKSENEFNEMMEWIDTL